MNSTEKVYRDKKSNLDSYSEKFLIEEIKNYGLYQENPYNVSCNSLLDIACGNGVFSKHFSNFFNVTGEDISAEGIKRANIENKNEKIQYKCCDCINEDSKHDVVFVRGPSFFIKNSIDSEVFQKYLKHLMGRCNKIFAFGQYNKNIVTTSYHYQSKEDLDKEFSKYGTVLVNKMEGNYLYVIVKIDKNNNTNPVAIKNND